MSNTLSMRDLLLEELHLAVKTTKKLIHKVQEKDWEYKPAENMRSLLELTNHLVQIPFVDLAIMQEKSEDEVNQLQNHDLYKNEPGDLISVMEDGYDAFKDYMISLPEHQLLHKQTKPFYFGDDFNGSSQVKWLIETTTHAFHHRAQFFNYLKQLGYEVNMFDLY